MGLRRRVLATLLASHRLGRPGPNGKWDPPCRVRWAFLFITNAVMSLLALLGSHPTLASKTRVNDKVLIRSAYPICSHVAAWRFSSAQILHFVGFAIVTGSFVWIWDIDDAARRQFIWRHATAILTGIGCFGVGAIGSEFIQSLLPGKTFQWGDIVANLLGASLGSYIAHRLERRHRRNRELAALYRPLDPEDAYPSDAEDQLAQGSQMFGGHQSDVWGRDSMSEIFALDDADEERSSPPPTNNRS